MEFEVRIEPCGHKDCDSVHLFINGRRSHVPFKEAREIRKRIEAHNKLVSAVVSAHGEAVMMARDLRDPFRSLLDRLINEQLKPALRAIGLNY